MRDWLRRHARLVISLGAIAVMVISFLVLASEVAEAETETMDHAILRSMRDADGDPVGPRWFERAVVNLSALGSGAVATLIVILAAGYLFLAKRPRHAALVIVCALGTSLAVTTLKAGYERPRPTVVEAIQEEVGLSFPSGHTFLASALYPTLGALAAGTLRRRRLQIYVFAAAAVLALLIGFTRVYIGVHHPTDVLAGWCLGLAWAIACGEGSRLLQREGVVEQPGATA